MVAKAFASFDGLQQGNEEQSPVEGQPLKNIAIETDFSNHPRQYEVVMEDMSTFKTSTPSYKGSSMNMLVAMLLLLNLRTIHGVCNVFMDELFSLLHKELLPKGNKMPVNNYEAFN
jgi:hypothetical protein